MEKKEAIIINGKDNVATALNDLKGGNRVITALGDQPKEASVKEDIPFLHKFALQEIKKGDHVYKYGSVIGTATEDITPGEHVHSHNLKSRRG